MARHHFIHTLATLIASLTLAACGGDSDSNQTDGEYDAAVAGGSVVADAAHAADSSSDAADAEREKATTAAKGGGNGGAGGGGGGSNVGAALVADAGVHSMTLNWTDNGANQYNVYVSSSPDCDIANYSLCPDGRMLVNVRPPYKVGELENGRVYYAVVEGIHKKGTSLSNEAGARPTTLEFNNSVWAIAKATDGTTYLGGDFTHVGLTSGQAAVLDASTGRPSVPGFPIFGSGGVTSAAPDGSGGWYLGGDFGRVNSTEKLYLVHVRADGSVDPNWNPLPDGDVWAIAVMNGVVYIGGRFSTVNGQQRTGLAAIDQATGQLMAWNPNPNLGVWSIAAANGKIYIGGTFTWVGAFRRSYLAAIDTFGNVLPWDPSADGTVATLAVSGSTVYAGGFFGNVSGQRRNKLAAIDATTGSPTAWDASLDCVGCEVRTLAVSGSTLYVGGRFPQIDGVARSSLAAVDLASGNVLPWNPGADYSVWSLAVINDAKTGTTIYAGGEFATIGGQKRPYLAALDTQGTLRPWHPAPTAKVDVVAAAGNQVLIGGRFTGLGAIERGRLAAIDSTGALTSWNPDANSFVRALAISGDTIYAGGGFTSIGGQQRGRLARLDAAGNVAEWNPGTNWPVLALALGAEGTLYAGGEFSQVAGLPRGRLAAFDSNGTLLGWAPNADREVQSLAVGPYFVTGETVYVGGWFSTINGQVRRRIAQIDAFGQPTAWNPWGYNLVGDWDMVHALVYSNGMIYAGGVFTQLGPNFAQITESGTIVRALGVNSRVWSLSLSGNTLTIGGEFTRVFTATGTVAPRNRLAAIDIVSNTPTAWDPNIGDREVYAIVADSEAVHVGGSFTQVGGQVVSGFTTLAP